ncbi:hypothetical protein CDL15_Pgr004668 [Punica granatum]|uniref:Uncharacterized protein n=1 Tax=Punica granatum TaxID=22663 RepID=A0A218WPG6_PUNGR|nr:hypothetical protein CDL15_Pgr004668 [Punica granatum]
MSDSAKMGVVRARRATAACAAAPPPRTTAPPSSRPSASGLGIDSISQSSAARAELLSAASGAKLLPTTLRAAAATLGDCDCAAPSGSFTALYDRVGD